MPGGRRGSHGFARGRANDVKIAATAAAHGAAVITRNPGDFDGLDGLVRVVVA